MPGAKTDEDYLGAFMSGLEFALLAMEGRLPKGPELEAFLQDYRRVLATYRHRESPATGAIRILGPLVAEADAVNPLRN